VATLPRSSKGLEDIASTTGIVKESTLLAENGIVTERAQDESYAVLLLLTIPFKGRRPLSSKYTKTQTSLLYEHLSYSGVTFLFPSILFRGDPGGWSIFAPALHEPSSVAPKPQKTCRTIISRENSMIKSSLVHMRFLRPDGQVISLETRSLGPTDR
jgi:hypothetical protein